MNLDACLETVSHSKILLEDRKSGSRSKLYVENPKKKSVDKIRVDDCLKFPGKQCDYAIFLPDLEIYIELKGVRVKDAIDQLRNTILNISRDHRKMAKRAIVVCSCVTPKARTIKQTEQMKFKKDHSAKLEVGSGNQHTITI